MIKIAFIKIFNEGDGRKNSHSITYDYLISSILTSFNDVVCKVCYSYQEVKDFKPSIVGVSTATESFMTAKSFINHIKENHLCLTILGGPHITALPETLPRSCNIGIIGEGEDTLVEIIKNFKETGLEENLKNIKGIVYREGENLRITDGRALKNLDDLPIPLPSVVSYDLGKAVALVTTRGCVNKCLHCSEAGIWKEYREMSADRLSKVIQEQYLKTKITDFIFMDDLSTGNVERLIKLKESLNKKRLLNTIKIRKVSANAELVTEDLVKVLKDLGVSLLGFGLESASSNVLKKIKCNKVKPEDFIRTIDLCDKYGIRTGASGVWGYPGETLEDMEITKQFWIDRCNKSATKFKPFEQYTCQPLPGSILWKMCLNEGKVSLNMDFSKIRTSPNLDSQDWLYLNESKVPRKGYVAFMKNLNLKLNELKRK